MTTEEAMELIPTHIVLRPEKDRWQAGDEVAEYGSDRWDIDWYPCTKIITEEIEGKPVATYRRPIPEAVRTRMALALLGSNYNPFEEWLLSTQGVSK